MKRIQLLLLVSGLLCGSVNAADDTKTAAKQEPLSLVGTWEMVSTKYGDATEFTPVEEDYKALKFITPTHFIWVHFDPKTKTVVRTMGGTITLSGNSYVEKPEFAIEGMTEYVGKEQKFTAKVEGDKWIHSGVLSDGTKLEEIWKKVK